MSDNIKYGIIGAGVMGQEHIHNINIIENAEVVEICDTNEVSTNQAKSLIKDTASIYDNIEDLINDYTNYALKNNLTYTLEISENLPDSIALRLTMSILVLRWISSSEILFSNLNFLYLE